MLIQTASLEVREMASPQVDTITPHDLQQAVTQQMKPIVIAVSALEKALQLQEQACRRAHDHSDEGPSASRGRRGLTSSRSDEGTSPNPMLAAQEAIAKERLQSIVEEAVRVHRAGEVSPLSVDTRMTEHSRSLLGEMRSMTDVSAQSEHLSHAQ